jgi:hypothetical protein
VYFHCSENSVNVLQGNIGCCFCKKYTEDTNAVRGQNAEFCTCKPGGTYTSYRTV